MELEANLREDNFPFLSALFSEMKPEPNPEENLDLNSHFFHPPSPHDYKPNTLFQNSLHNFDNHHHHHSRGIDLNYSDQYHHHHLSSPLLGDHLGGSCTTIEGSSSNPFCGIDLTTIERFNPFDACYNHQPDHPNHVNVFPYVPAAAVSLQDSQKAVMHGGWGDYDDVSPRRHQDSHHHQIPAVQLPGAAQPASCIQLPPLINFQEIESAATPGVMLPPADEYSSNITQSQNELQKKKRLYMKKASKQEREAMIIKGQWTPQEDRF